MFCKEHLEFILFIYFLLCKTYIKLSRLKTGSPDVEKCLKRRTFFLTSFLLYDALIAWDSNMRVGALFRKPLMQFR